MGGARAVAPRGSLLLARVVAKEDGRLFTPHDDALGRIDLQVKGLPKRSTLHSCESAFASGARQLSGLCLDISIVTVDVDQAQDGNDADEQVN